MMGTAILAAVAIGIVASIAAGAVSGLRIGKDALGAELAAYMGGLYGVLAGGLATVATVIILLLV